MLWQIGTCSISLSYVFRSFRSVGVLLSIFEILLLKSLTHVHNIATSKGKAIPLWAWTGPEGSRRLRLPDFKTIGTW